MDEKTVVLGAGRPKKPGRYNPWGPELEKFLRKEVEVTYLIGPTLLTVSGTLVAFNPGALYCVVATKNQKVFIRVPLVINRARTKGDDSLHVDALQELPEVVSVGA